MITPERLPPDDVDGICARMDRGEVLLLPTDTVYGLCCDPRSQQAVDRIFRIKSRDRNVPLAILVSGRVQAEQLVMADPRLEAMDDGSWPSTLTAVMTGRPAAMLAAGMGGTKVGIRRPEGGLIHAVIEAFGPLASTSANRHGQPVGTEVEPILDGLLGDLADESVGIDALVDGGIRDAPVSTVVDVVEGGWLILRPGALDAANVALILGPKLQ